jgi:hypothetical protein
LFEPLVQLFPLKSGRIHTDVFFSRAFDQFISLHLSTASAIN